MLNKPVIALLIYVDDSNLRDLKKTLESLEKNSKVKLQLKTFFNINKNDKEKIIKNISLSNSVCDAEFGDKSRTEFYNHAVKLIETDYVGFVYPGDTFSNDKFEKQLNFLEENKNVEICGCWEKRILPYVQFKRRYPIKHEDICSNLLFTSPIYFYSALFRTNIFKQNNANFLTTNFYYDYDLFIKLWKQGYTFANLPEELICSSRLDDFFYSKKYDYDFEKVLLGAFKDSFLSLYPIERALITHKILYYLQTDNFIPKRLTNENNWLLFFFKRFYSRYYPEELNLSEIIQSDAGYFQKIYSKKNYHLKNEAYESKFLKLLFLTLSKINGVFSCDKEACELLSRYSAFNKKNKIFPSKNFNKAIKNYLIFYNSSKLYNYLI